MKISDSFYPARESQEGNVQAIYHKVNGVTGTFSVTKL